MHVCLVYLQALVLASIGTQNFFCVLLVPFNNIHLCHNRLLYSEYGFICADPTPNNYLNKM